MDKLLKHAIDDDAVSFIDRFKSKMDVHHASAREDMGREVASDMAGTAVQEKAEKIACLDCDEVSTKAAWKKNNGTCPKCKKSTQGVAESAGDAKDYLKKEVIKKMIKSGKWEVSSGDADGKTGSSLVLKSHTGKSRNVIIEAEDKE